MTEHRMHMARMALLFFVLMLLVFAPLVLTGCADNEEYRAADDRLLCDLVDGKAYFVKPAAYKSSFVIRVSAYDHLCVHPSNKYRLEEKR